MRLLTEQICRACGICTTEDARGECESCGMPLWGGTYRLPGLHGRYCSILCMELELAGRSACHWCFAQGEASGTKRRYCDDICRKQAEDADFGTGVRLLNFLRRTRPELYSTVMGQMCEGEQKFCDGCHTPLTGKNDGTRWCSDTWRKRYSEKSRKTSNGGKKPETHIQNKGLIFSNLPGKGIASTGQGAQR